MEYIYHDESLPNVLIVENDADVLEQFETIDEGREDVDLLCDNSPNKILIAWQHLFAQDHIPRALICDWGLTIETLGVLTLTNDEGIDYKVKGAAYVLIMAMTIVRDCAGMFVIYTNDPEQVSLDILIWSKSFRDRVHIIDRKKVDLSQLLSFVLEHGDYTSQDSCELETE